MKRFVGPFVIVMAVIAWAMASVTAGDFSPDDRQGITAAILAHAGLSPQRVRVGIDGVVEGYARVRLVAIAPPDTDPAIAFLKKDNHRLVLERYADGAHAAPRWVVTMQYRWDRDRFRLAAKPSRKPCCP